MILKQRINHFEQLNDPNVITQNCYNYNHGSYSYIRSSYKIETSKSVMPLLPE